MKYKDAAKFREALENKIASKAKKENLEIERLRRDVAFDRFLVRLFILVFQDNNSILSI